MSENRYGEKREESETGMKLQNCETQESENKIQESTNEQIKDMGQAVSYTHLTLPTNREV